MLVQLPRPYSFQKISWPPLDYLLWRGSGRFCQEFAWVENNISWENYDCGRQYPFNITWICFFVIISFIHDGKMLLYLTSNIKYGIDREKWQSPYCKSEGFCVPIIRYLIFILWRSVRKTTIILGMKKLRLW
jgi:hypothetical protein